MIEIKSVRDLEPAKGKEPCDCVKRVKCAVISEIDRLLRDSDGVLIDGSALARFVEDYN